MSEDAKNIIEDMKSRLRVLVSNWRVTSNVLSDADGDADVRRVYSAVAEQVEKVIGG